MLSEARRYAAAAKKERADRYSANVPVIREIQESGVKALPPCPGDVITSCRTGSIRYTPPEATTSLREVTVGISTTA
jgi:hypothetical protein